MNDNHFLMLKSQIQEILDDYYENHFYEFCYIYDVPGESHLAICIGTDLLNKYNYLDTGFECDIIKVINEVIFSKENIKKGMSKLNV